MKVSKRMMPLPALGAGLMAAPTILALALFGGDQGTAHAQGPITLGIDMDPYATTANSCPGDGVTDCTLGPIDQCKWVSASEGTTFEMDVYIEDLWNGHGGFSWNLTFPDTMTGANLTMISQIPDPILGGNTAINLILQSAGSGPLMDVSEGMPDALTPHVQNMMDFGSNETTPPYTQGTLVRYEFSVGAAAVPGLYGFSFVPGPYEINDQFDIGYSGQGAGINVLDANSTPPHGIIALGVPCDGSSPISVGGIAELPDVSGWSGPNYVALAGVAAAGVVALSAGAWYARRRWLG